MNSRTAGSVTDDRLDGFATKALALEQLAGLDRVANGWGVIADVDPRDGGAGVRCLAHGRFGGACQGFAREALFT